MDQLFVFDTLHQLAGYIAPRLGLHAAVNVLVPHTTVLAGDLYAPDRVARHWDRQMCRVVKKGSSVVNYFFLVSLWFLVWFLQGTAQISTISTE
ncbi:hypothetical protein EV702DRAFT_1147156 [Suillus placidus]|uniref:Uncharacterized protein n=1 Tax=Suillus placidus TaxID=48579 RepID=A0A9P6ZJ57_9AGAM|nr:hypothetical protein EV702DRAFT_1147156 [Suillus placidus]